MREAPTPKRGGIPRGLATEGPPILSYGFRPFFLAAGLFAPFAMLAWIGALVLGWEVGGSTYGALAWHAHEMLFGYAVAPLAGFMLTAIPNWTGRLPVAGRPLLGLVATWLGGRLVMLSPDLLGAYPSAAIDLLFLPLLAAVAAREIVAGRNWKNLKILAALLALAACNFGFHLGTVAGWNPALSVRPAVAVYVVLVGLVGGRIIPSFTRNWLVKAGQTKLPAPFGRFDIVAMAALVLALSAWTVLNDGWLTTALAVIAAVLQLARLWRWRGVLALEEPLLLMLHLAYLFIPLGLIGIALQMAGWLSSASVLHVFTVGVIGAMTLAVMTRATRGHTGRRLIASWVTSLSYLAMLLAAVLRPFAELLPDHYHLLLEAAGTCWIASFALFLGEYGRMLVTRKPGT